CCHVPIIFRIGLFYGGGDRLDRVVTHLERANLTVDVEDDRAQSLFIRRAHGIEAHDHLLQIRTVIRTFWEQVDDALFAFGKPVEEVRVIKRLSIAVVAAELIELIPLLREEQAVERRTTLRRIFRVQVYCFFLRDIAKLQLAVARGQNLVAQRWPTTWRGTKLAAKEGNDRIWNVVLGGVFSKISWVDTCTD